MILTRGVHILAAFYRTPSDISSRQLRTFALDFRVFDRIRSSLVNSEAARSCAESAQLSACFGSMGQFSPLVW